MPVNVSKLLQCKTVALTVDKVVEFALKNSAEDFNQIILQFFINVLGRSQTVTVENLDPDANVEELKKVLKEISESTGEFEIMNDTIKNFLNKLMTELFANGLLTSNLITKWIQFLKIIATHPDIPENSTFTGQSLVLMSLLLSPLASLYISLYGNQSRNDSEELLTSFNGSIKIIMEQIPNAFVYKTLSVHVATEFIDAMENYPKIFVSDTRNYLPLYKKMMLQENSTLHSMALKSLLKLCSIESIHNELKNFLFQQLQVPNEDGNFLDLLLELAKRKSLKGIVIALLRSMVKFRPENDFISHEKRQELYADIFSGSKKLVSETVALMIDMKDKPWMRIIELMDVTENIDLPHFIETLSSVDEISCDIKSLVKVLIDHLNTPKISQRAAEVLTLMLKHDKCQQLEMLHIIDVVLEKCSVDELTFCLMLECFIIVDIQKMSKFYKNESQKLVAMIDQMTASFDKFNQLQTLYNIIYALKTVSKILPSYVLKQIRRLFQKIYNELLDVLKNNSENKEYFKQPLIKLIVLFENRSWNIIPTTSMAIIYQINQDQCQDSNSPMFPYFIRFHVNFMKHIWARLVVNKPIPFSIVDLAEGIKNFYSSLFNIFNSEEIVDSNDWLILCSLLDIALMFQPAMREISNNKIFELAEIKLDKKSVRAMAMLVDKFVFSQTKKVRKDETLFQHKIILLTWISFFKNYTRLPSLTSSEIIICHYRLNDPLQTQVEILMESLLSLKSIFEQTVAVVTFNMSMKNDMARFKLFHRALEIFLARHFEDDKKRISTTSSICFFILSNLKSHVEGSIHDGVENRLVVLDYVATLVKNISLAVKQKLVTLIADDWNSAALSENETKHLNDFKTSLKR